MNQEIITFDDTEIEKRNFHYKKNQILFDDADIDKMLIPVKVSSSEKIYKYFIGYKNDD